MGASVCIGCLRLRDALATAQSELEHLTAELAEAHERIRELVKLTALQGDDLKRLLALMERRGEPNQPERVSDDALQLAFKQILARPLSVARTLSDVGWPGVIAGKVPTGLPESVARLGQAQRPPGGRLCPRRSGAGRAHNDFRCQRVSRLKQRVDERIGDAGRPRAET